jgi:hypothetical protein
VRAAIAAALGDFKGDEGAFSTETKLLQSDPSYAIHAATAIGASGSSDPLFAAAAYANPATCRGEILDASKKSLETPNHIFASTTGSGLVHKSEVLSKILDYERAVPGKFRRQFNRDAPHEYIFLALG